MILLVIILYITLCLLVGTIGAGRKIGFFSALVFALILSPLVGYLITLAYPKNPNTQEQAKDSNLKSPSTQPFSSADELLKLGRLLEKGLISAEEFEAEKKRILDKRQ